MNEMITEVSAIIDSPPSHVYHILADYKEGHPAILPKKYFSKLVVLEGGVGAGTIFETQINFMGIRQKYHVEVSEPDPGHILVETDEISGGVVTFCVDPVEGGSKSLLTMSMRNIGSKGIKGLIENLLNPYINRRICTEEIGLLRTYLQD